MSQQPGEYAGDAQRGQCRPDIASGAAPDYGQPSGYDFPDSRYPQAPGPQYAPPYVQDQGSYQNYGNYGYDQEGGYQPAYQRYDENYEHTYGQYGGYAPEEQTSYRQLSASLILDDGSHRHYQLTEGSIVVGRGQDAQFRLPDTGVSRRHLEITWDGRTAMLVDLGSTNGTTVNGTPVQTWQLADGDVVRVGQSRLVFRTQS